jgi:hypothetical protein
MEDFIKEITMWEDFDDDEIPHIIGTNQEQYLHQ